MKEKGNLGIFVLICAVVVSALLFWYTRKEPYSTEAVTVIGTVFLLLIAPLTPYVQAQEIQHTKINEKRMKLAEDYFNEQMQKNNIIGGIFGITHQDRITSSHMEK